MAINAVGVFRVCQAVANQMIRQGKGGKIVCITSQADFIAINKHVGYTMSKAAVVGMIKVCALEWAEYGINVEWCRAYSCEYIPWAREHGRERPRTT